MSYDHEEIRRFSEHGNFSVAPAEILDYGPVIVKQYPCLFHIVVECIQVYMIKERCWFSQINFFIEYFPHRINIVFLSSQFYVIHIHR